MSQQTRIRRITNLPRLIWRAVSLRFPKRLRKAILIITTLQLIGTLGYPLIEGPPWTMFDGFYMTAITLATIGYGELYPLSTAGRLFTVILAYSGIFTLAYFASEIVRMVVSGELKEILGRERMEAELASQRDHLIVCGFGRMGKIVCDELERQKRRFVVVDIEPVHMDISYSLGLRISGDATEDEVLRKAGIERARALITVVGSDSANLYITLSARLLNPQLMIVARAEEEEAEAKLLKVGANKVISPYLSGGHRAVQAVLRPTVLHFMEMTTRHEFLDLQMEEILVAPGSSVAGRSLREIRLTQEYGVIIVGIQRPNGELLYAPQGDVVIEAEATLIAIGQRKQLDHVESLATTPAK